MHLIVLVYCLIYRKDEPLITRFIKMSIDVAKILIFANLAPVAMHGYQLSLNLELGNCIVSYGLYWTTAITLPINLIWTGIINGTHLFD